MKWPLRKPQQPHVPVLLLSTVSARITSDGTTILMEHNRAPKGRHPVVEASAQLAITVLIETEKSSKCTFVNVLYSTPEYIRPLYLQIYI